MVFTRDRLIGLGAEALADVILNAEAVMEDRREATAADNSTDCGYRHGLEAAKNILSNSAFEAFLAVYNETMKELESAQARHDKQFSGGK